MKIYSGFRNHNGRCIVRIWHGNGPPGRTLPMRRDLFNHSPTGFEWGYSGSGPAQLALALLADVLGDDDLAIHLHQDFKRACIARLERNDRWRMTEQEIRDWVALTPKPIRVEDEQPWPPSAA